MLDKPAGLSSHACVARVRRAYGLRRVGHGGTLDPAVTGVLPIALGPATRLLPYLSGDKAYRGVIRLGISNVRADGCKFCVNFFDRPELCYLYVFLQPH